MKELYDEYFHIPKDGKISDKIMLMRVVITATLIILYLLIMSLTAYAYFYHNVTSASNIIKSADFNLTVTVTTITDEDDVSPTVTVESSDDGSYLLPQGKYSVKLEKIGTATTGFCVLEITLGENEVRLHTQQIGLDGAKEIEEIIFTLDLSDLSDTDKIAVKFSPHWGTSSYYDAYKNNTENDEYVLKDSVITVNELINLISKSDESELSETIDNESETTDSDTENAESEDKIYIIQSGDTLSDIARRYDVSVERLAAYNGIKDPNKIVVNDTIKIPPPDWEIPDDNTDENTKETETTEPPIQSREESETEKSEETESVVT